MDVVLECWRSPQPVLGVFLMSRKILYIVATAWVLAFIWQTYAHAGFSDAVPSTDPEYCSKEFLAVQFMSDDIELLTDRIGRMASAEEEMHEKTGKGPGEWRKQLDMELEQITRAKAYIANAKCALEDRAAIKKKLWFWEDHHNAVKNDTYEQYFYHH